MLMPYCVTKLRNIHELTWNYVCHPGHICSSTTDTVSNVFTQVRIAYFLVWHPCIPHHLTYKALYMVVAKSGT